MSAAQFVPWLSALDALGVDSDKILARVGVPRDRLSDPDARLPAYLDQMFWDAALAESGDPALSLRLVEQMPPGAFGSFEYVLRNCETVEQIAARANEFMRLLDDLAQIEIHREGEHVALRLSRVGGYPVPGPCVETVFALMFSIARQQKLPTDYLRAVHFAHRTAAPVARFERHFGCAVRFGAEHNDVIGTPAILSAALGGDPNLRGVLEELARHQLKRVPQVDPLLHTVRSRLRAQLRQGCANLSSVSRSVHMSERTLRRRLQEAGSGYQALLDELRAELAVEYVLTPEVDIATVSRQLGFSEPSTFYRAFKRWTGLTPAQYQKQPLLGDVPAPPSAASALDPSQSHRTSR
jgi:AraC-like DNA-binding protein